MRRSVSPLWLFASATLAFVVAEPARTVAQTQAECDAKRRSCIAECRAQHFTVDPKRGACIANCEAEANKCIRKEAAQQRSLRACIVPQCFPGRT